MKNEEKKYVNEIGICPYCEEENLEYGAVELEDDMCYFPYKCNICGKEGQEWYRLEFIGHNIYDDEGNLIELDEE